MKEGKQSQHNKGQNELPPCQLRYFVGIEMKKFVFKIFALVLFGPSILPEFVFQAVYELLHPQLCFDIVIAQLMDAFIIN